MPDRPQRSAAPVLYFVRGRGLGHAHVALALANALAGEHSSLPLRFVSYGTGAETLRDAGVEVTDLGLPERNTLLETVVPAGELLRQFRPPFVLAHEEFAVPVAAKILGVPSIFLTDWFSDPSHSNMRALEHADEILFIDESGVFEEPEYLRGKVRYVGPVLRQFAYDSRDRGRARRELGLADEQFVAAVFIHPGRRDETVAPVADSLYAALQLVGIPAKVIWLSGPDEALAAHTAGRTDSIVFDAAAPFDQLMAACDLAITKGNRNIVLELTAFGVPVISISHGLNRIDDIRTSRLAGNITLAASRLTPETLARYIRDRMPESSAPCANPDPASFRDGAQAVAARLKAIYAAHV